MTVSGNERMMHPSNHGTGADQMRSNSHFKKHSAVFQCRICTRRTRDTNGDNGSVQLCEDCNEGSMQENGFLNTDEPQEKAQYESAMHASFQRAVNKGGIIEGYTKAAA